MGLPAIRCPFDASSDPSSPDFELKIPDLPYSLEEAQHILDLEKLKWALWALLALVLFLLAYRILHWLMRRAQPAKPQPKFVEPTPVPMPEIARSIVSLRDRHLSEGTFRQGCHELADLLRGFYANLWHEEVTTKTVREIQIASERRTGAEDGGPPGWLFGLLEGLQFSRREPTATDLEAVCDLASDVTSVHGGQQTGEAAS